MVIAYASYLKDYAVKLLDMGFDIVQIENARYYDALIYSDNKSDHLIANTHPSSPVLFLDITNISPKDAAHILKSGLYSPLF